MKKLTTKEFIQKARQVHGNKYDYSMVEYKGSQEKIKIICPIHGIFLQKPNGHLLNHGCSFCGSSVKTQATENKTKLFLSNFENIDFSKCEIKGQLEQSKLYCIKHGYFNKMLNNMFPSKQCNPCYQCEREKKNDIHKKKFIEKSKIIYNNKYDYSQVNYTGIHNNVIVICPLHGAFNTIPNDHMRGKSACPVCKASRGEQVITRYLQQRHITYEFQKRFDDCKDKFLLPFDFYIPNINTCIEYDGEQHFIGWKNDKDNLKIIQQRDQIKTNYCKNNNINLIRINYKQNIEDELNKYFGNLQIDENVKVLFDGPKYEYKTKEYQHKLYKKREQQALDYAKKKRNRACINPRGGQNKICFSHGEIKTLNKKHNLICKYGDLVSLFNRTKGENIYCQCFKSGNEFADFYLLSN